MWVMTKKESGNIQSAVSSKYLNYTLQDRMRNEDIRAELEVKDLNEMIAIYRRQWWDHLQRMTEDRLRKAALNYKAIGRRDVGAGTALYNLILEEKKKSQICK